MSYWRAVLHPVKFWKYYRSLRRDGIDPIVAAVAAVAIASDQPPAQEP